MSNEIDNLITGLTNKIEINGLRELVKSALEKNVEIVKYSSPESDLFIRSSEAINKFYDDFSNSFSFLSEDFDKISFDIDNNADVLDNVFNFINQNLDKYELLLNRETVRVINTKAVTDVKKYLSKNYSNHSSINEIKALSNSLVSLVLPKYLLSVKELNDSVRTINDEWYNFVCNNYYGDASSEDSVENRILSQIIEGPLNETGKEWKGELLRLLVTDEQNNILFNGFENWFKSNYVRLVSEFYKWSENRYNYIPTLSGLITTSILESLEISKKDLSKSDFIKVANGIIERFKNDNLRDILNSNSVDYNKYESLLDSVINHYVSYSKNNGISHDLINQFSLSVTMIFINYCNMCLTNKVCAIDSSNDYKINYARWIQSVDKSFNEALIKEGGFSDSFFSSVTPENLESIFKVDVNECETAMLNSVRGSYGRIKNKLKEIFTRKLKAGSLSSFIDNPDRDDANKLADKYIQDSWGSYDK